MNIPAIPGSAPAGPRRSTFAGAAGPAKQSRIPGSFQFMLAIYVLSTGSLPTIVQALAFGVHGGVAAEFAIAMAASLARDLLLLTPVLVLANHPLGILHPLLLAVVVWPVLMAVPGAIEDLGGWAGVMAGSAVQAPYFVGLPGQAPARIWAAIAKYNALECLVLLGIFLGFWFFRGKVNYTRKPSDFADIRVVRSLLIGIVALSLIVLMIFLSARGGLVQHLTSLGRGRFSELSGDGPVMLLIDLGTIALYLWVAARPNDVRAPRFILALAAVLVAQFVSNGSRSSALLVPLTVGLIWALRRQRVPWKIGLLLLPLFFASLGLMNAVRNSSSEGWTASEAAAGTGWSESFAIAQKEIAWRQSLSAQVPIVERGFDVTGGPLLGRSYIAALVAFVPRPLWKDKPRGPGSLYAQLFLGLPKGGMAIPVTQTTELYWNFWAIGAFAFALLYGVLLRLAYHFYWRRYPSPVVVVFYALFITTFRFSTDFLVAFQQQLALLLFCTAAIAIVDPGKRGLVVGPRGTSVGLGQRPPTADIKV